MCAMMLSGCSTNSSQKSEPKAPGRVAESSKPRDKSPNVSADELTKLAADNADFGTWSSVSVRASHPPCRRRFVPRRTTRFGPVGGNSTTKRRTCKLRNAPSSRMR